MTNWKTAFFTCIFASLTVLCITNAPLRAAMTQSGPITINGQSGVVIENTKITSSTGNCVTLTNATNITIHASEIGPCKGNAIVIQGGGQIYIYDSYIHAEGTLAGCCDHADNIFANGTNGLTIQGNVIAYGEANMELQNVQNAQVKGNFLLNPRNAGNRGQQVQCLHCTNLTVDSNYGLSSMDTTKYTYAENQEDAFNFISGSSSSQLSSYGTFTNNYLTGGHSGSGCGIIADDWVDHMTVQYNTLVDTGQCGLGIAGGTNIFFNSNKIHNTTPVTGGGNTAIYVWNQYTSSGVTCDTIQVQNNIAYALNTSGQYNSYWNGGGCTNVAFSGNTLDGAANTALTPVATVLPPPKIPPVPYSCVISTPYTNQTSPALCGSAPGAAPPSISVTSPTSGQVVAGTATLLATASSSVGVAGVQFQVNGAAVGSEVTAAPYSINWNSASMANGPCTVTAVARDTAGARTASSGVSISVNNVTPAGAPVSDDFNGTSLNTSLWTSSAPAGGSVTVSGAHAVLSVPGGANHDVVVGGDNAVRILQPVANADFNVAAKFDSMPAKQYQGQGILVQQDSGTYLRFEMYSDGSQAYLYGAVVSAGSQTTKINTALGALASPCWLKVQRSGSTWTLSWSTNGTSYQSGGSFSQTLTLAQIGLYAWNYNNTPANAAALTASVDYFYNLAGSGGSSGSGGSGTAVPDLTITKSHTGTFKQGGTGAYTITVSNAGTAATSGTVTMSDTVPTGLTPTAASGTGWTCSISGQTVTCTQTAALAANSSYGPITLNVNIASTAPASVTNTATVSGGGETNTSNDSASDPTAIGTSGGAGAPVSDTFNETSLNTALWTFVNPKGDASYKMTGTTVSLSVPAGTVHDPSEPNNTSVRLEQTIANGDLSVEVKFDSKPTLSYSNQGLVVEQDSSNYVRFEFYGQNGATYLYAGTVKSGVQASQYNQPVSLSGSSVWMRVKRSANTWTLLWSSDGTNYQTAATFTYTLTVAKIGPMVANYQSPASAAPAFTAAVEYFHNIP